MKSKSFSGKIYILISAAIIILIWKLLSLALGAEVILPSPESALDALIRLTGEPGFLSSLSATVKRGILGFLLSAAAALVLGIAAGESPLIFALFRPLLTLIKTIPLLSIILLAVIWLNTESVPVFVCFLVVFPVLCSNVIEGIRNVDSRLLEMASIYRVGKWRIIFQIYLPSLVPYLLAGLSTAAGVTWKAVIAAEVISLPRSGIGTGMETSQLQLDTASLFAWTILAVVISALSEMLVLLPEKFLPWRKKS